MPVPAPGRLFRNVLDRDRRIRDLAVRFVHPAALRDDAETVDLNGLLALPAFVDGHIHLDKSFVGDDWRPHRLGTVAMRSHVDVDASLNLDHLHAVMAVCEAWRGKVDVEIVAFPQAGILASPDTADLLDAAIRKGAGVAIMTNAPGNRAFPPVSLLRRAGVRVFTGNDNIHDAWLPYGDADMLGRAMMIGYRSGFFTDADLAIALDMATTDAAAIIGRDHHGMAPGDDATFVLVDAANAAAAVAALPSNRRLVQRGEIIAAPASRFETLLSSLDTSGHHA